MAPEIEFLSLYKDVRVAVSGNHKFGTDAVLLAHFAQPKKTDMVLDLGTGCGIIPLLLLAHGKVTKIQGVEISREACELAKASAQKNNFDFEVINADLKNLSLPQDKYDLITCNPPYFKENSGLQSLNPQRTNARHEVSCCIGNIANTAKNLLKHSGKLCLCTKPERLTDTVDNLMKHALEPKKIRLVAKELGSEPWLILIEAVKGAKRSVRVLPTLYCYENSQYSQEMKEIYKD